MVMDVGRTIFLPIAQWRDRSNALFPSLAGSTWGCLSCTEGVFLPFSLIDLSRPIYSANICSLLGGDGVGFVYIFSVRPFSS